MVIDRDHPDAAYFTGESMQLLERAEFYPKLIDRVEVIEAMQRLAANAANVFN
jgi:hypothetical protein